MKKYDYNNENLETNDSTVNEPAVAYAGYRLPFTDHGSRGTDCKSAPATNYAEFQQHRTKLFGKNIEHLCFDTQNFKFNRNEANER